MLYDWICVRERGKLPLDLVSQPLELIDVAEHLLQKRTDRGGQIPPTSVRSTRTEWQANR